MASFFAPPPFLSYPRTRSNNYFSSSQTPNPQPSNIPSQPQNTAPTTPQLSTNVSGQPPPPPPPPPPPRQPAVATKTTAESTDWIASTLTRRFGIGAGLAWVGFLTFGVVSEQIKTRFEVSQQEENTRVIDKEEEVVLPNGIRYYDLKIGGGSTPRPGDLVVINIKGCVKNNGQVFLDTFGSDKKRALALVMGSRPYNKGICEGIEFVLRSMKAGGKRRVIIPPVLGYGEEGAEFGEDHAQIPPFATLEYVIEVEKVSIAPA